MEAPSPLPFFQLTLIFLASFLLLSSGCLSNCYNSIFSFGDSLTDTGNMLYLEPNTSSGRLPYGETFFHHPTGRCSDGRLVIDFLAEALGIPLVPPYLPNSNEKNFKWGANFAVAGATALDADFFAEAGIPMDSAYSLGVQLNWFQQLLPSICSSISDCQLVFRNTLFIIGEIGGNDYGYASNDGWIFNQTEKMIPLIIAIIESAMKTLIEEGATSLLVPSMLGFGCLPSTLAENLGESKQDYDPRTGCLTQYNEFSQFHNRQLVEMLDGLRGRYPHVTIVYADFYQVSMRVYESPHEFGFKETLRACCGVSGPYNYNASLMCAEAGVQACEDPSTYVSWDGVHGTEAIYKTVTREWLNGSFTTPFIFSNCQPYVAQV